MISLNSYKYNTTDILGKGTFSVVYQGYNNKIKYAVKKIDNKIKETDTEIRLHSPLNHPNIVEFIDVIYKSDFTYIILEYCRMGNFQIYIEQYAPFDEEEVINYLGQISRAVKYLYDKGILHRDIKPNNILMKDENTLKLCDFSFAVEFWDDTTIFEEICGSPAYIAPEIKKNHIYNNKSDLWSIGMILYQMLYGKLYMSNDKIVAKNEIEELLVELLQPNPCLRINWKDYFEHDIISDLISDKKNSKIVENEDYEDIFIGEFTRSKPINIKGQSYFDF